MNILDLEPFARFRDSHDVKLLRHMPRTMDLWAMRRAGEFKKFQDLQRWDVIGNAQYVFGFIAERHNYAKFVGVWEVHGKRQGPNGGFRYRTSELAGFESLEARLIIQWGEGTRSWSQWLHRQGNKRIVELLPPDYVMEFPGYYNFMLRYDELKQIIDHPDSNREWVRMLAAVSGIYLILDEVTGKQYVGSAYGSGGILARWRAYAKNPAGGNALLADLLWNRPKRHKRFRYSLLRVMEPGVTKEEVLAQERLLKVKLGSRAFGLNLN